MWSLLSPRMELYAMGTGISGGEWAGIVLLLSLPEAEVESVAEPGLKLRTSCLPASLPAMAGGSAVSTGIVRPLGCELSLDPALSSLPRVSAEGSVRSHSRLIIILASFAVFN